MTSEVVGKRQDCYVNLQNVLENLEAEEWSHKISNPNTSFVVDLLIKPDAYQS